MFGLNSSPIRKAFELAATIKDPINFSIGQPHFTCPSNIVEAMVKAVRDGKTSYTITGGIPELKEALIAKYETYNQINYATPDRILITSGVSSALLLLFNAFINPGDEVLLIEPYFLIYKSMLDFYKAKVITIPENFNQENLKDLNFSKLKFILFSNPSNPTGYILSKEQLLQLTEIAEKTGAYIVSDEIYELFDYDKKFVSLGSLYEKTITLTGFSKTFSMTGLRLASILSNEEVNKALTTLQQYTIVCAPSTTQYAGIEALRTDMSSYIQDYKEKRDFVYDALKDHYPIYKSPGAFYYFLPIKENDEDFIKKAVLEKKVILVPGYIFTNSHNFVRMSYASEWENLKRGVQALIELAS
ncbi:MAG: aminotransferase class I/II-fold pyridoxal phosphate-dependent enzyme [Leptospiraceae bacterium]|nr:aminotransferase class I/II-fold pyridoxal phosphate-dependent enzyme [Leptospiraceae bacterium]